MCCLRRPWVYRILVYSDMVKHFLHSPALKQIAALWAAPSALLGPQQGQADQQETETEGPKDPIIQP